MFVSKTLAPSYFFQPNHKFLPEYIRIYKKYLTVNHIDFLTPPCEICYQCCAIKHQKSKSRSKSSSDGYDSHDCQVPLDFPTHQPAGSPWKNPRFGMSDGLMKSLMIISNSSAVHSSITWYPINVMQYFLPYKEGPSKSSSKF